MDELNQKAAPQIEKFLFRRLETLPPMEAMFIPIGFGLAILAFILLFSGLRRPKLKIAYFSYCACWVVSVILGSKAPQLAANGHPVLLYSVLAFGASFVGFVTTIVMACLERSFKFLIAFLCVGFASAGYVGLGLGGFLSVFSWWYILIPLLLVGLFYVGMMYMKDSRSVHPAWAGLLGFLRCMVYAIIGAVFLLPGCQTFDIKEFHSNSLLMVDVSLSMANRDERVRDDKIPPTRGEKVLNEWLLKTENGKTFFDRLLVKTPLTVYSFGSMLDDGSSSRFSGREWSLDEQRAELKPLVTPSKGDFKPSKNANADKIIAEKEKWFEHLDNLTASSNYGGSIYQLARIENNTDLQAVIIVGDGSNNLGDAETIRDALALFTQRQRPVPIITVGVGSFLQPASIVIQEPQGPEAARPDDKFLIRVPVIGVNLVDEPFTVTLKVRRKYRLDDFENQLMDEKIFEIGPVKSRFEGQGDNPRNTVDFEIDIEALKGIKTTDEENSHLLEGKWEFIATVPRHEKESFPNPEHVSEPIEVVVQKRKMRVLLFSGGPPREYQMLRTALYRESLGKRLEMSIFLQNNKDDHVDQDVEAKRFLAQFPTSLVPTPGTGEFMALTDYDVIIAVDADWTALSPNQLNLVKTWVGDYSGGIVFVAGPIHTYHLARPGGVDIKDLKAIFPVELKDSRLHNLGIGHDATRKYVLNFPPEAEKYDFLKLDESAENPLQGWENFFWGTKGKPGGPDARPKNGFYNYYPVERLRPDSIVMASFAGPVSSRIEDGKREQPFIVGMRYGSGRTVYVGSSETWRLIHYKEEYHKRFWIKVMRHVGSNTTPQKKYGTILISRNAPAGAIAIEAQIKGKDLLPSPRDTFHRVTVRKIEPDGDMNDDKEVKKTEPKKKEDKEKPFDLKAKETKDEWKGWFAGTLLITKPGDYEVSIPIEDIGQSLTAKITVRKPNPELDNPKPDLDRLYQMASDVNVLLKNAPISQEGKNRILELVTGDRDLKNKNKNALYFKLEEADKIEQILTAITPRQLSVKGQQYDLWDKFWKPDWLTVSSFWAAIIGPWIIAAVGLVILLIVRNYMGAVAFCIGFGLLSIVPLFVNLFKGWGIDDWPMLPVHFSVVLISVVGLLCMEWFLRKLLKLA